MSTQLQMSDAERERRRMAAVAFVNSGHEQKDAAEAFGVSEASISAWMKTYRRRSWSGLKAEPRSGRPRKLSAHRERQVLGWFSRSAVEFGFSNELWTARRVAQLIHRKWKVKFHPRYVNQWLAERRITPQKPERRPRERDDDEIRRWLRYTWPQLKNAPPGCERTSF
jgi:transposase